MSSEHPPSPNGSCTRQCPTPTGDTRALITHCIAVAVCVARQREFYHKCHRCMYRGKAVSFVAEPVGVAADEDEPMRQGPA